jgi:tRNA U55 pseudouridine synthase TruB
MIIHFQKFIGETMNEVLDRFKLEYPNAVKVSYAGRLDPLAFGTVIILTDEDTLTQNNYCNFDKEYKFKLIHGIQTDTYDILGLITNESKEDNELVIPDVGSYDMYYPPYSSYKIKNKPLWYYTINKIAIDKKPMKKIKLIKLEKTNKIMYTGEELLAIIQEKINTVKKQTFRQIETLELYTKSIVLDKQYVVSEFDIALSSGGFVRHFGNMMGGVCYDIERVQYNII